MVSFLLVLIGEGQYMYNLNISNKWSLCDKFEGAHSFEIKDEFKNTNLTLAT